MRNFFGSWAFFVASCACAAHVALLLAVIDAVPRPPATVADPPEWPVLVDLPRVEPHGRGPCPMRLRQELISEVHRQALFEARVRAAEARQAARAQMKRYHGEPAIQVCPPGQPLC